MPSAGCVTPSRDVWYVIEEDGGAGEVREGEVNGKGNWGRVCLFRPRHGSTYHIFASETCPATRAFLESSIQCKRNDIIGYRDLEYASKHRGEPRFCRIHPAEKPVSQSALDRKP
jgi:hypothetical protein